ncbi:MAG: TRAP transporter small permease [Jannaschia sp.]
MAVALIFLHRLSGWCRTSLIVLCSLALVTLVATFGWLVFGRYVLNATPTWVEQLALLLIVYISFLGAAAGVHEGTHLGVSFIREGMPDMIRKPLRLVVEALLAGFGLAMAIYGMQLVQFSWTTNLAMLNIPEGVRILAAPLSGGLIFVFAGTRFLLQAHEYYIAPLPAQVEGLD